MPDSPPPDRASQIDAEIAELDLRLTTITDEARIAALTKYKNGLAEESANLFVTRLTTMNANKAAALAEFKRVDAAAREANRVLKLKTGLILDYTTGTTNYADTLAAANKAGVTLN